MSSIEGKDVFKVKPGNGYHVWWFPPPPLLLCEMYLFNIRTQQVLLVITDKRAERKREIKRLT